MTSQSAIVEELEHARRQALVAADGAALDLLLSESLVLVHTTGKVDTKATFIESLLATRPFIAMDVVEQNVVAFGEAVVVTGQMRVLARPPGAQDTMTMDTRITCVWAMEEGDWRLTRYQSTRIVG